MNRLDTVSKELSNKILNATNSKQKEVIINSCIYAVSKSQLDKLLISTILEEFKNENLQICYKEKLEGMLEQYENEYFDMQEAEEKGDCEKGKHLIPFGKARTLSAILCCFDDDLAAASTEAVYEASMVSSDYEELLIIIENTLSY